MMVRATRMTAKRTASMLWGGQDAFRGKGTENDSSPRRGSTDCRSHGGAPGRGLYCARSLKSSLPGGRHGHHTIACRRPFGVGSLEEGVSDDKPERDLVDKRGDYAEGRVPEYWIVNPRTETITVLSLRGDAYEEAGVYRRGEAAASVLLPGLTVAVAAVFDAN